MTPSGRSFTEGAVDTITTTATSTADPSRWVRVRIGLRDRIPGEPFLATDPSYACAVTPVDDFARTYRPANWESGVISGAGYATRRWLGDGQGLLLSELDGRLGGDGIEAIALATAAAVAALLHREPPTVSPVWSVRIQPPVAERQGA
jgi:hypothetical protein